MTIRIPERADDWLNGLATTVFTETSDVLDYIWKAPNLIKTEERIEREKLEEYFSEDDVAIRNFRWQLESRKLYRVFPLMIALGNLYTVISLFENYMLRLGKHVEERTGVPLNSASGQGMVRLFRHLRSVDIRPETMSLWPQINAAISVRNCLIHASGLLPWSREEPELRRIVASRVFLSGDDRNRARPDREPLLFLVDTPLGSRLQVTNQYAWIVAVYLRDFLIELIDHSRPVLQTFTSGSQV